MQTPMVTTFRMVQNLSMLNIPEDEWYGILHSKDYDNDSIPDSYELRMACWAHGHGDWWNKSEYLNPANPNDTSEDFDGDGLTNLEEYQRDPSGDYDGDGTPDIYDTDDDGDGISTSVKLQNHLDPCDPSDAAKHP